jgi:hypothetical protein
MVHRWAVRSRSVRTGYSCCIALDDFGTEQAHIDITPTAALDIAKAIIEFAAVAANVNGDSNFFTGPLLKTITSLSTPERVDEIMRKMLVAVDREVELRAAVTKLRK